LHTPTANHEGDVMDLQPNVPVYAFDDELIANHRKIVRRWLPARVFPYPVVEPDRPWEGRVIALYGTVLPDPDGGYRMYYSRLQPGPGARNVFMATSPDGFAWEKPALGVAEWEGRTDTNIVLSTPFPSGEPSLVFDPDDPACPWKMIVFQTRERTPAWGPAWGLWAYRSADGLRWEEVPGRRLRAGDRTNLMAQKVDGRYVMYTRHFEMFEQTGGRAVYRSESPDFLDWTEPELVLAPDLLDAPDVELYGMSAFRRHGWFFGLLEYWRSDVDTIETHLVISRDGRNWQRTSRQPFIAATCDWNRTWSTCASNGPVIIGDVMVFHFGGRYTSHHYDSAQQYGAIGYASLPIDRFCALEGTSGGRFDTAPMRWPGGDLVLNADTRESYQSHPAHCNGEIAVEVLDESGAPLPEWSGDSKATFRGNTHCRTRINNQTVTWPDTRSLNRLAGQPIRLRIHLRHARLFALGAAT
jgi:hypothetical protein